MVQMHFREATLQNHRFINKITTTSTLINSEKVLFGLDTVLLLGQGNM